MTRWKVAMLATAITALAACNSNSPVPSIQETTGRSLLGSAAVLPTLPRSSAETSSAKTTPPSPSIRSGDTVYPTAQPSICGVAAHSTGPASKNATLSLSSPASAVTGSTVEVQASIKVHADGGRIITLPNRSTLVVTRAGVIVGRSKESEDGLAVPVILTAGTTRPAQAIPRSIKLVGCRGDLIDKPLPAGDYKIVAVLGYGQDSLNSTLDESGAGLFQLVSEPSPIRVE